MSLCNRSCQGCFTLEHGLALLQWLATLLALCRSSHDDHSLEQAHLAIGLDRPNGFKSPVLTKVHLACVMQLLGGRKRPDGGPVLQIEELRDGIVAFEDESDAERYRALLQAEGSVQVCALASSAWMT